MTPNGRMYPSILAYIAQRTNAEPDEAECQRILQALENNPKVLRVEFDANVNDGNGALMVYLDRMPCEDVSEDNDEIDITVPKTKVYIMKHEYLVKAMETVPEMVERINSDGSELRSPHPNISGSGNVCVGNDWGLIDAWDRRDIPMLIASLCDFMTMYNSEDPYWVPSDYRVRSVPTINRACDNCSDSFDPECHSPCGYCRCNACENRNTAECPGLDDCDDARVPDDERAFDDMVNAISAGNFSTDVMFGLLTRLDDKDESTLDELKQLPADDVQSKIITSFSKHTSNMTAVEFTRLVAEYI